jgi:beta-galactosidase
MDLCGFPKDLYWFYRAWWSNDRVLHLFPHWNWEGREGQMIDVRCFSNCDEVELLVNDRNAGRKRVERNSHVAWQVPYAPGRIEAVGFVSGKPVMRHARETTGTPSRLQLGCDRSELRADGRDVAVVRVSAVDETGREHPTADNLVHFEISGAGRLLGVGNGDPSSHESDKAPLRKLFNGLAMVLVQAGNDPGELLIDARADGLAPARLKLAVE